MSKKIIIKVLPSRTLSAVRLQQHPTYHQHLLMEIPLTFLCPYSNVSIIKMLFIVSVPSSACTCCWPFLRSGVPIRGHPRPCCVPSHCCHCFLRHRSKWPCLWRRQGIRQREGFFDFITSLMRSAIPNESSNSAFWSSGTAARHCLNKAFCIIIVDLWIVSMFIFGSSTVVRPASCLMGSPSNEFVYRGYLLPV